MTSQGMGQDDIAFKAYVEDFTIEFFDRFDDNVSKIANKTEQGFAGIDDSIQKSGKSWGILGGIVGGVSAQVTQLLFNLVQQAIGFAKASVSLTARVDTLGITLQQMGTRAGYTVEQLAEYEEALKSTGITTRAARTSMIRMIRANIDLAEAAKLARIAQDSAVVAGINSSAAFERLILGIQKREPELLDELGLTLNRAAAYDKLGASIGKAGKELSNAEQQQAILNDLYDQAGAVAGVYEAAMGSVGKQTTSTARYVEELQIALGDAFQPSYQAWVQFMQSELKELGEWFIENEDAVKEFGEQFGIVFSGALNLLDKVIEIAKSIPGYIEGAGVSLASMIAYMLEGEEGVARIEENAENIGLYFKQAMSIIAGAVNVIYQQIAGAVKFIASGLKGVAAAARGDIEGMEEAVRGLDDAVLATSGMDNLKRQFDEGFEGAAKFFGLIDTVDTSNAEAGIDNITDALVDMSAVIAQAEQELMGLMQDVQLEFAQDAMDEARRLQEEAIKIAHRMEDIQRNHAANITRIMEQGAYNKENAVSSYEEIRFSIVRDYHRRLRALQEDFEFEGDELARKRDAVGLLRLARQHKRQLKKEEENRDLRAEDAKRDFEKRLKMIDEQTRRQLDAAEKQRQGAIDQLNRQLDRERELRNLHDQWEQEARREKYQKLVEDMIERYVMEEGLTAEHANRLLQIWSNFYSNEAQMLINHSVYMDGLRRSLAGRTASGRSLGTDPNADIGIFGQGGQVSSALAAPNVTVNIPSEFGRGSVPRIPAVAPSRSSDRRELIVKVEGTALEPAIQRQLVASLIEVERNRGA